MNKKIVRPVPFRLSQWCFSNEVLYSCPKCGTSFQILGDKESYCHGCGVQLDWKTSPRYCSDEFKKLYWASDEKIQESMRSEDLEYRQSCKQEQLNLLFKYYRGELK